MKQDKENQEVEEVTQQEAEEETMEEKTNCCCEEECEQAQENEDLEAQIKMLEDKNLRLLAEFNNYKKRSSEEYMQAKIQGKVEVFKKLVDTLDNFERALAQESSDSQFYAGMQMIYEKLKSDCQSLGLEIINCEGKLDHRLHQALMIEENADLEDDVIVDVLQNGYIVENVLVRPSMVKVNKKPSMTNENQEQKEKDEEE